MFARTLVRTAMRHVREVLRLKARWWRTGSGRGRADYNEMRRSGVIR